MAHIRKALNYKPPAGMNPGHGVFVEPLGCAVPTIDRAEIRFNDVVALAGCGSVSLGRIAAARMKSPKTIVARDLHPVRLELARTCGADVTINPREQDRRRQKTTRHQWHAPQLTRLRHGIRMIAEGCLPMDEIISHKLSLEEFETGIEMVIDGSASLKVTLRP